MTQHRLHRPLVAAAAIAAAATISVAAGIPAFADNGTDTSALREAVTVANVTTHLEALQAAADGAGGNRAAGTPGHVASAEYIEAQLTAAGYTPMRQYFSYDQFILNGENFEQLSPSPTVYVAGADFLAMDYSASADVSAAVSAVDINLGGDRASTSGCEAADFAGFPVGNVALIQRGTCTFREKVDAAAAAGAAGVIIFNQGNTPDRVELFGGTLASPQAAIPAVSASFDLGAQLAGLAGLSVRINVDADIRIIETWNILADTSGRADRTVVVGGHLDSVSEGPGINDNGSGVAAILETAIQFSELGVEPTNRVRFAFWSGEEDGLIGSNYYAAQLSTKEAKRHALNLNFDMVGSPNAVRFVYDGDGSAFGAAGPNGSDVIEDVFLDYFGSQGQATEATEFDGRSDYFGFIEAGIPAGGLFTGAEGVKSAEQAAIFGGTAGLPYDPCYHAACDTIDNIDPVVLEEMIDAIAHSTLTFAQTTSVVNGTAKGGSGTATEMEFQGQRAQR